MEIQVTIRDIINYLEQNNLNLDTTLWLGRKHDFGNLPVKLAEHNLYGEQTFVQPANICHNPQTQELFLFS